MSCSLPALGRHCAHPAAVLLLHDSCWLVTGRAAGHLCGYRLHAVVRRSGAGRGAIADDDCADHAR
ncbi:MAG: hypothetical protein ACRDH5_16610, partial [bacterium]